jgi:hypothetical protein
LLVFLSVQNDPRCSRLLVLALGVNNQLSMNKTAFWNGFGTALQPILKLCDRTSITGKVKPRQAILPLPHTPIAASSTAEVDNALQRLDDNKQKWVLVDTTQRAALLTACLKNFMTLAKDMAVAGTNAKGSYEGGIGDEM